MTRTVLYQRVRLRCATLLLAILATTVQAQTPINFVRTWEALTPQTDASTLSTKTAKEVRQTTQYLDGLGRPIQTVIKQGSLNTAAGHTQAYDLVSPVVYDAYGREEKQYLPFVAHSQLTGSASPTDGSYKSNALDQQNWFYSNSNALSPINGQGDTKYYSQTVFEASPLNRLDKQLAPGESWVGANRGITSARYFNTALDEVRIWNVTDNGIFGDLGAYASPGIYAAGTLYKNSTTDEMGNQVLEFMDKEGKVILKKAQASNSVIDTGVGKNHAGWDCTYYIYDDLGQLRCVLQPEGVRTIRMATPAWQLTNATLVAEQCFRYAYDQRGRMIVKKVPGAGEVRMVYDGRDRLVLTQDANMRANSQKKWLYTHYDELNRPVKTGLIVDEANYTNHEYHYNQAYTNNTVYPNLAGYVSGHELLTETGYDTYSSLPGSTGLSSSYDATYRNSTYMDTDYGNTTNYAVEPIQSNGLLGKPSWTKIRVLGTVSDYLYSIQIYDEKGRVIQTQSTNLVGGVDIVSNQYSWNGNLLTSVTKQVVAGTPNQETIVVSNYTYDNLWRQEKVEKRVGHSLVNSGALPSTAKTTAVLKYDGLGQLKDKNLGSKPSAPTTPLANLHYQYNIRGWLLGINKAEVSAMTPDRYFAFELGYNRNTTWGTQTAQYGGNIASLNWKTAGEDDVIRKLNFTYDWSNRLLTGTYSQNVSAGLDFTTNNLSYDPNGNIKGMRQYGWKPGGSVLLDNFVYTYNSYSNKLKNVRDAANDPGSLLGDFKVSLNHEQTKTAATTDYAYDANGNLVKDLNKDMATTANGNGITYNHLNLPSQITVRKDGSVNRGTISYTYDAGGTKLRKTTVDISTPGKTITTVTDYLMGQVYESRTASDPLDPVGSYAYRLQLLHHEEGRIRFTPEQGATPAKLSYDYFLKDHLGNVRMVLTEDEESETYPTLTFNGTDVNDEVVKAQNTYWENKAGERIDVINTRTPHADRNTMLVRKSMGAIGATKLLKVMSGDRIHTSVEYRYETNNADNTGANGINSLVANIATLIGNSISPTSLIKSGAATLGTDLLGQTALANILDTPNEVDGGVTAPKAYLHVLLFNEQFQFDATNSRVLPVEAVNGAWKVLSLASTDAVNVKKNGYAYVYFSNESDEFVYFTNFTLTHDRGPISEETHYYPFGLTMAGISSRAMGKMPNRYKYNGIEQTTDLDLNQYDAFYRTLDPQIGRWWQIDPKIEQMDQWSPYVSNFDNPISNSDPKGDIPSCDWCKEAWNKTKQSATYTYNKAVDGARVINTYVNPLTPFVEFTTGKSVESDFTISKSRKVSALESAITLIPGGKAELSATKVVERNLISLDNNALIHAIEKGGKEEVVSAIGNAKPIVSFTAAKEFLVKGDKGALKEFMTEIGATISNRGASSTQVVELQQTAERIGRKLGEMDARILGGAINNGATILTNDRKFGNFLNAIGFPFKNY